MKRITFLTSAIGLCLAGYLVAVGMLDSSCAFEPVCEYFLGLPTYYYGFALFFAVVLVLLILRWRMVRVRTAEIIILAVSLLGIVFSGYYALRRMPAFFTTPAIGFLFFFVIFTITLVDSLAVRSDTQARVALGVAGVVAVATASETTARDSNPFGSLVSAIAQRFNLNPSDVRQVFDQQRQQLRAKFQQKHADRVTQAVASGRLTRARAHLILAKQAEVATFMASLRGKIGPMRKPL